MLSGGEKSRVALAKILLKPSNLLLLDEPTNHLDMQSKEILLHALQNYQGAILFISHDRYFMDHLAEKIIELKDGVLTEYLGNYSEYLKKITEMKRKLNQLLLRNHPAYIKQKIRKNRKQSNARSKHAGRNSI